jgi:hypothetical protein
VEIGKITFRQNPSGEDNMSLRIVRNEKWKYKRAAVAGVTLSALLTTGFCGVAPACAQSPSEQAATQAADVRSASPTAPGDSPTHPGSGSAVSGVKSPDAAKGPTPFALGVGVKVSPLGIGAEVAAPLTRRTNLRVGYNQFSYGNNFTHDGISYGGNLNLRSMELLYDWFPFGGAFHLSPGLMAYNGNQVKANASVAGGQSFTLNHTDYISDPSNPITGTGKLQLGTKVAPMFLFGFGNLVPRHRHFSISVEAGAAFTGSPKTTLSLRGNACDAFGITCVGATSDPGVVSNIQAEQVKLNHDTSAFKLFPVLSIGFGYKF